MHGCSEYNSSCACQEAALMLLRSAWDDGMLLCRLGYERELFASCMGAVSMIAAVQAR